jgi:hypothetical protein
MDPQEQLAWLLANNATVWFTKKNGVKIKVDDRNSISGHTLEQAIANVEQSRRERDLVIEAYKSLGQEGSKQ